jgi:hypothetical protein
MARFQINFDQGAGGATLGRLGCTLFSLLFGGMGVFFVYLAGRDIRQDLAAGHWDKAPCVIVSSRVTERNEDPPYVFEVSYRYSAAGAERTGTNYRRRYKGSYDYAEALRLARRYAPGTKAVCRVNPEDPAEALLAVGGSGWHLIDVLFPMGFVLAGIAGIYLTWRRKKPAAAEAISDQAPSGKGAWALAAFMAIFLLAGIGFLIPFFVQPVLKVLGARDWPAVPCRIESSRVRTHEGDDGDTYSVDILYAYEVNGEQFKSNRYHFMGGSSSGYEGKKAVVNRHKPGTEAVCYVNPKDPTEAVLERGFTPELLFGLIPMVFVLVGGGGLVFAVRRARRGAPGGAAATWMPRTALGDATGMAGMPAARTSSGPVVLKPKTSPFGKLLGIVFVALFWNGIVSVFVWQVVQSWLKGSPDYFQTFFMIPFALIGLGLIGGIGYFSLAALNPRTEVRLSSARVRLGEAVQVTWQVSGRWERIDRLRVYLEGREEATYRRGTSTYTDKETFRTIEIADTTDRRDIFSGSMGIVLPKDTMHSFEASHNKIIWDLRVRGEIRHWPDVKDDYPFVILPEPVKRGN